jgi:hypothetical protein
MLQETNSAQECWTERDGALCTAPTRSVFPDDALAVIYKPARSAMTSGKARTRDWKLRFEPRSAPYIEPLMGWTGCDDTLSQVELTFPSASAAVAYAWRQGLHFVLQGADDLQGADTPEARPVANLNAAYANSSRSGVRPWRLEWIEQTLGLEGIQDTPGPAHGPAARYASPQDVLHDRYLSPAQNETFSAGGSGCVFDRARSLEQRTAIRSLASGRGDRRTVRFERDADRHANAPDTNDGAGL